MEKGTSRATSGRKGLGTASPAGEPPLDPCSYVHLTGCIIARQPAQHRLSLTSTGPSQPLCEDTRQQGIAGRQAGGAMRIAVKIASHISGNGEHFPCSANSVRIRGGTIHNGY